MSQHAYEVSCQPVGFENVTACSSVAASTAEFQVWKHKITDAIRDKMITGSRFSDSFAATVSIIFSIHPTIVEHEIGQRRFKQNRALHLVVSDRWWAAS